MKAFLNPLFKRTYYYFQYNFWGWVALHCFQSSLSLGCCSPEDTRYGGVSEILQTQLFQFVSRITREHEK